MDLMKKLKIEIDYTEIQINECDRLLDEDFVKNFNKSYDKLTWSLLNEMLNELIHNMDKFDFKVIDIPATKVSEIVELYSVKKNPENAIYYSGVAKAADLFTKVIEKIKS